MATWSKLMRRICVLRGNRSLDHSLMEPSMICGRLQKRSLRYANHAVLVEIYSGKKRKLTVWEMQIKCSIYNSEAILFAKIVLMQWYKNVFPELSVGSFKSFY